MKLVISGSRSIKDYRIVFATLDNALSAMNLSSSDIELFISGGAVGVDRLGEDWARRERIPIKQFLPDWSKGRGAGIIRNKEMAKEADLLIAIWDGQSKGTKQMIEYCIKIGLRVAVFRTDLGEGDWQKWTFEDGQTLLQ